MKKLTACLLIIVMSLFTLGACGTGGTDAEAGSDSTAAQSQETAGESDPDIAEIPQFETVDLEGNTVDNSIFRQADITVINIWGTYCPPCVDEMPQLAEWSEEMPDNVQIIGLIIDVDSAGRSEYETALDIVRDTGVNYTNLLYTEDLSSIYEQLIGVPTTLFVDSEGRMLSGEIVGADVEGYKKTVEDLL